jgi:hypothetical protein
VTVSGGCQEDVSIQGFEHLTLNAVAGASISDPSAGANYALAIVDSQNVFINGFTINGAVLCATVSGCAFSGDTFQNSPGDGVTVTNSAYALFSGGTITNNPNGRGLVVAGSSRVNAAGITVSSNGTSSACDCAGIRLVQSAMLALSGSTIENNGGNGIRLTDQSSMHSVDNTVTGNAINGVALETSSEARFTTGTTGNVITGNANYGVLISDLSLGNNESAGTNISGNHTTTNAGQPEVECVGKSEGVGVALSAGTVSAACIP